MIQPINAFNNTNRKSFTSTYDAETRSLLYKAEMVFDEASVSTTGLDLFVSKECGDVDLVKQLEKEQVALSRFSDGNLLLQVVNKDAETVDVLYHNVQNSHADKFFRYKDTAIYPWNKGKDIKLSSDFVHAMKSEQKNFVETICKKYIPQFLETFNKVSPTALLKTRL